ncbi:MAG: hypothetical protein II840_05780 [Kiritimatiellae bacterium]|nr:hypothetical protein [Kiritimatiellia bacterium]
MNMTKTAYALAFAALAPCAFAAEGNMYGNQAQNEGLDVVPAPGKVVVDGSIDPAEWDLSGQIWSFADWDARETFSVKSAAMYDAEFLYLAFDWRDPIPLNSKVDPKSDPGRGWMADAVQLRTCTDSMVAWFTMWGYDGGKKPALEYVLAGDGKDPENKQVENPKRLLYPGVDGVTELGEGVELAYKMAPDGKGFTQEVKIPWRIVYANDEHRAKAGDRFRMGLEFYWGTPAGTGFPMHNYKDNLQPGVYTREFFWRAKKAWGDVALLAGSAKRREYRPSVVKPEGPIAVRATVPAGSEFFSLVVDDADGRRVRNIAGGFRVDDYRVGEKDGKVEVEVRWDGLDESGKPAPAGRYVAKTIGSGRIDGYWELCFYNPGTPAWDTLDHRGGWGADHSAVKTIGSAGDMTILCCDFAEGGDGTLAIGPDGRKAWGEKRGSSSVAGNGKYVFIVPNDWDSSGVQLCRLDAKTGAYLPFRKGEDMPIALAKVFGLKTTDKVPSVLALAINAHGLLVLCNDNLVRILDPETGVVLRKMPLHATTFLSAGMCPFAADDANAYTFFGRELQVTDIESGKSRLVALVADGKGPAVENPGALAVKDGVIYVADNGADMQIKKFGLDGRQIGAIGVKGGRPRQGAFVRDGVRDVSSLAFDAEGRLWVAENQQFPRRVSVFTDGGAFVRDYLGNAGYAGGGTLIHRQDPTKACAAFNEISIDIPGRKWDVTNVMFNPDPTKGIVVRPGATAFHYGDMFYSSASGEKREYFSSLGDARNTSYFIMIRAANGDWQPVAAIATLGRILGLVGGQYGAQVLRAPFGEWKGHDAGEVIVWNDFNNDGYLQLGECEFVPAVASTNPEGGRRRSISSGMGLIPAANTTTDMDDLGFYATRCVDAKAKKWEVGRMVPVAWRDGGRPVYSLKGFVPTPNQELKPSGAATEVPGEDLVVGFITHGKHIYVAGWRKSTGEILWKHVSPYHQVHGSHNAPMPRPGLVIGCLKVMGVANGCGDKSVFMVRGNLGEDYFFTTDGFLVNRFTKDGRLPGLPPPEDEELLRKSSYANYGGRGEHFSGTFARQDDGVVRLSGGIPASQAGNIFRIEGLEGIRSGDAAPFELGDAQVVEADKFNTERQLASRREVEPLEIAAKGARPKPFRIGSDGQKVSADFSATWDAEELHLSWTLRGDDSPWRNRGKDWRLLFKTGDCVDFQLSPTGNRGRNAAEGDFRLLVAPFGDSSVAVLMKERASGSPSPYVYNSPVTSVRFDSVTKLAAEPRVKTAGGRTTVELDVAWSALGMAAPAAGAKMSGDVGFILSDAEGNINVARVYRANKSTNLVNDQPGEARIVPNGFAEVLFK